MAAVAGRGRRRRTLAEMNMVPFIDVMLVLLIIFMVTAPLLNLGVDIELPQANAAPISQQKATRYSYSKLVEMVPKITFKASPNCRYCIQMNPPLPSEDPHN